MCIRDSDNSLNKYPKIRFNKANIKDIIIGSLLLVIVILGGIIVYLVNNLSLIHICIG